MPKESITVKVPQISQPAAASHEGTSGVSHPAVTKTKHFTTQLADQNKTPLESQPVTATTPVVQRAVGFEYELDSSNVYSKMTAGKKKTLGIFGGEDPVPLVKLEKGLVISDYGPFDVSVDSTPKGFDVEIRIKEVDHMSPDGLVSLSDTIDRVLALLDQLQTAEQPITGDFFPDGDPNIEIIGDFGNGTIQATAGLSLTALYSFLSGEMGAHYEKENDIAFNKAKLEAEETGLDPVEDLSLATKAQFLRGFGQGSEVLLSVALAHTEQYFGDLSKEEIKQVAAVITSFLTIPLTARGQGGVPYAKAATTLLARSDYATVFKALPDEVLEDRDKFKALIMETLNKRLEIYQLDPDTTSKRYSPVGHKSRIYPQGQIENSKMGLSLTIGEWLDGLLPSGPSTEEPKDLLSEHNYPRHKYPKDDFGQLESMGKMKDKTDPGKDGQELPIFEFRRRLSLRGFVLKDTLQGMWELIKRANG